VVGDVLLDVDLVGRADRLSPEDAAPVVQDLVEQARPGGAGLAAVLAAQQADVVLAGAAASDAAGRRLAALLPQHLRVVAVGRAAATVSKTRIRAAGRTLVRLDRPGAVPDPIVDGAGAEALAAVLARADAVLVADYGLGLTRSAAVRAALERAAAAVPVLWDPHPRGAPAVPGTLIATPNHGEAAQLAGRPAEDLHGAIAAGRELAQRWGTSYVLVTRGAAPAVLASTSGSSLVVPVEAAPVADSCGAGDALAAGAAVALAGGAGAAEAAVAGVHSAGQYLRHGGPAALEHRTARAVAGPAGAGAGAGRGAPDAGPAGGAGTGAGAAAGAEGPEEVIARVRRAGGQIVMAGGCFDVLHAGHVAYLEAARALGDCLVVAMNSDAGVRRLKGPHRPLVPAEDRARVLRGLGCVDAVVEFDEPTPALLLRRLRPDVFAKGGDYLASGIPEAPVVTEYGGAVVTLPTLPGRSTTGLIAAFRGRGHPSGPVEGPRPQAPAARMRRTPTDSAEEAPCPPVAQEPTVLAGLRPPPGMPTDPPTPRRASGAS
jgi:rfaE bifunctional protein nucleotidyltransferase chain/domain/rfaE bifunctional protein kinase chain/domain